MKTRRILAAIVAALALTLTAAAQNMTQQQANQYLTGTWNAGGKVLSIAASGNTHTANIFGNDYDNWSIYTNTFNFAAGSLQATNSSPFRNMTIKYHSLTQNSCEFFIDGNWIPASKSGCIQQAVPTTTQRPVITNNNARRPVKAENAERPRQGTLQRPNGRNNNAVRPVPANGKGRTILNNNRPAKTNSNTTTTQEEQAPVVIN